jgi:hypothetical protein
MEQQARARNAGVVGLVIAAGVVLSFLSALVPFFAASYRLDYVVMFAGLLPYLVYGCAAPVLARGIAVASGLLLLLAHGALLIGARLGDAGDYSSGMLHYGPIVLAVLMLPLLVLALRQPY